MHISRSGRNRRWMTAAAVIALLPAPLLAQTPREAELEARLQQLEAAVTALRTELDATRVATSATATQVDATEKRVAAVEAKAQAPAPAPADGFRVGTTAIKIGGFIKTVASFSRWDDGDVASNALGRDFYLPQQIPVGGIREGIDNDISAKQTRLWLNLDTTVAGHVVKGYVETDFQTATGTQGSERTTNGYNLALRRAYVQVDKFTVGQDWSTFQYVAALPESTDFVGPTEGTMFVRDPLIRYSMPVGAGMTLHVSAENAESATATLGSVALVENDDDRVPDIAARLNYAGGFGELSLAGLARQLSVDSGTVGDKAAAWGVSAAGKLWLNAAKTADLRFMLTYGQGIGRYVGLNFVPDAIYVPGTARLHRVGNLAALAAVRIPLGANVRSNLMAGYQDADYPGGFAPGALGIYNQRAWSVAANLFWTPVKQFDVGVELRHATRELVNGQSGQLDRLEFAAKYSF